VVPSLSPGLVLSLSKWLDVPIICLDK
jgi:hypothetical protein